MRTIKKVASHIFIDGFGGMMAQSVVEFFAMASAA